MAEQVEQVRGLEYVQEVSPEALSREQMSELVRAAADSEFPLDIMERRQRAWAIIGAIRAGTDLHQTMADYGASQTIGLYDTATGRLFHVLEGEPSPLERFALAHELTHALDDQHFDLGLVDELIRTCQDERIEALVGLAEGDAMEMSLRWAQANLSASELLDLGLEVASAPEPPASVPQFVQDMFISPYVRGQAFVQALLGRGGQPALDAAFRDPPRSTEQIMHPEKYGADEPQLLEVPDLEEKLGEGWDDLDVQDVGESWLLRLLGLELPSTDARAAAAGWDGGRYRAWENGAETVVLLETVWDSEDDAVEFADAVDVWAQGRPVAPSRAGTTVRVLFASSDEALAAAREAAAL